MWAPDDSPLLYLAPCFPTLAKVSPLPGRLQSTGLSLARRARLYHVNELAGPRVPGTPPAPPVGNLPLITPAAASRPQLAAARAPLLLLRLGMSPHPERAPFAWQHSCQPRGRAASEQDSSSPGEAQSPFIQPFACSLATRCARVWATRGRGRDGRPPVNGLGVSVAHGCPPSQHACTVSRDVRCRYPCQLQRTHGETAPGK